MHQVAQEKGGRWPDLTQFSRQWPDLTDD